LVLSVAACGNTPASPGSTSKAKIVFVLPSLGNQAFTRELAGAQAAAAQDPTIDLIVVAPGTGVGTANQLIPKIQNALTQHPAALVVNGGAAEPSLVTILQQAASSGVKIVTFDVAVPGLSVASFVNLDDNYTSALGGQFVQQQLPNGGELGLFSCYPENPVTIARVQGFYLGLQGWKGWTGTPVQTIDTKCDSATARTGMENMLVAHPNLKAVYSTTDQDVTGILEALKAANKTNLVVVAHDCSIPAAQAILQGRLQADIANPFEQIGFQAVQAAANTVAGKAVPSQILIKSTLVTKANAQAYIDNLNNKSLNP
jgi:ribose transport system substrate-binding protein